MTTDPKPPVADAEEWARRRSGNVRLAYVFGGLAVVIFFLALWLYRPM